jgi:hypothetical protein
MSTVRSVDFLPEIFQTDANRQFLAATLDQLIQEPKFKKTEGFIGRRVGPGVTPRDRYVVEPTTARNNYQLEPVVVSLEPDTDRVQDAITYAGINDTVSFNGGVGTRPDRLYTSDYYTWDPFIDFDKFVNFSQYFWVPNGPDTVNVSATDIPVEANYAVNRENGVYQFGGLSGNNPTIELIRGGNYTFQVAQNNKETVNYRVRNSGTTAFIIDFNNNPDLNLARGNTYVFNLNTNGLFPFWIKTQPTTGLANAYNDGVSRNGATTGLVTFTVPQDAPDVLYYVAQNQALMQGKLNIVDSAPGTGPGFWIQTAPGISGQLPQSPNISSRDVLGVENNGTDLGVVTFNVPLKTAQSFYYDMPIIPPVDLITDLRFDQINNQPVEQFVRQYGGIDGIAELNGRTVIFTTTSSTGWEKTSLFDPLPQNLANNGQAGSYDSEPYDLTIPISESDRQQIWQITYVRYNGDQFITLNKIIDVDQLTKFSIRYGNIYSSTQWFKNSVGQFEQIPLLSAAQDTLFYQDGTDPEIFGRIRLIDPVESTTIFVDEIIGSQIYTSPNGITFTNGLKIRFTGSVEPARFRSGLGEITYTQTESGSNYITSLEQPELEINQQIIFNTPTLGGLEPGKAYYIRSISANGLKFTVSDEPSGPVVILQNGQGTRTATTISNREYYVSGVGSAIELLPVDNFVIAETYARANNEPVGTTASEQLDYLTINRAGRDRNAWSRSNRWFHIDTINAAAAYNNTAVVLDNAFRAKRPIIEFRPGIRLWNMGTEGQAPVDIIDFTESDAFSNIEGTTEYSVNGYSFVEGTRVIFAADSDPDVRNKIYTVSFVNPDTVDPLILQPIINMTLTSDGIIEQDQSTVVLNGNDTAGKTYWYDGNNWIEAQQKTNVQQAPLFNVYDLDGVSFDNNFKYPSTTFAGSKLFSYAVGDTNLIDPILQFPLQYLNINNVGDIVFENNLYKDSFLYVEDNVSQTVDIGTGVAREYQSRTDFKKLLGWQNAATVGQIYQQFQIDYRDDTIKIDIPAKDQTEVAVPVIKIYVNGIFVDRSSYSYTVFENQTFITFIQPVAVGEIVEIELLSDFTSDTGFYQVPDNFESNPLNANSDSFTLGTIRTHYQSICENLINLRGPVNGANNVRDLGNIIPFGLEILQQSAPLTLTGYFFRNKRFNIFESLTYNSREYVKFKAKLLDAVTEQNIAFKSPAQVLDDALDFLNAGKVETQPFYWSDMLPSGVTVASTTYPITFITTNVFDTVQVYNYQSANYLGLLVYKNETLLTRNVDYTVAVDGPRITILSPLSVGDKIIINEYQSTAGSFVPNTPTKLGLYPSYLPEITTQVTTDGSVDVLIGHDGSVTPLFGDLRDSVLLEFETRVYNNLKLDDNPVPLMVDEVLPGQFRPTDYAFSEINNIFAQDFLSYVGWNKLDYKAQLFDTSNEFTWNYTTALNKLDNQGMPAAWRGIYRYFYDTQQPSLTPWEMLGLSERPAWWNDRYGPAPYTRDNLVLWDDLEIGLIADPVAPYINPRAARPGLTKVIPTGSEGELLSPYKAVVGRINDLQIKRSWNTGDGGPVEAAWWNSSAYPFSVMRVLALTQPAKFFALFADRDRYRYNKDFDQYLYDSRFRLDANGIEVYGNGISKASYINWVVDYNRTVGIDSTRELTDDLRSIDVRLGYRMASFSDKQYIKLFTEKSSPNSINTALMIPDESYDLLLYKNQPFDRLIYSSVAVQKTESGGYAVFGYSTQQPYFTIFASQAVGRLQTYSAGGVTVQVPTLYSDSTLQVPYGFVFDSLTSVSDFLLSYGKYLERQGFEFTDTANGYVLDWPRMVQEFLYWSQQGWDTDAIINLNPLAGGLQVTKLLAVADNIVATTADSNILDQNSRDFPVRNLNIVRLNNTFKVEPLNTQTLSFADLSFVNYEHIIILNNQSVFGDLIYDPTTGARQSRLNLTAVTTTDWNGTVNTPGFILNQNNVEEWTGLKTYSKGEIVRYKDVFWSALKIVQPSATFNFNDWTQSDYEQIELGLLPNIANKADQLVNSYNINLANIETDNDLLGYGLIGFRPRQYLAALNLDDVSQVNIYRQFLGVKGTIQSAKIFQGANLGKEAADYDVYENWAVQQATYGSNANRSFVELRLDRSKLASNPSLVQVTLPEQTTPADQSILLSQVWQQSYRLTSPDFLPTTIDRDFKNALPSAGYVNLNNADITVFDINDPESLDANFDRIQAGTVIWVAKINDYDWNIYQAIAVPGQIQHVCDNLNGTSRVIFSDQHNLTVGNKLIIKSFDTEIDGIYTVLSPAGLDGVNIAFQFSGDRTVANGTGIGLTLQTMRVGQASDVVNLPYTTDLKPGARAWVDNNGQELWQVIEKQEVFSDINPIAPAVPNSTKNYGASIAQSRNQLAMFVGSPGFGFDSGPEIGALYVYVKGPGSEFEKISPLTSSDGILTLQATGVRGYGNSVTFGDITWAAAGASGSLGPSSEENNGYVSVIYRDPALGRPNTVPYAQWQLLTQPGTTPSTTPGAGQFGYTVDISSDERWLYVGAPGLNQVHAYSRVPVEDQVIRVRGNGSTTVYTINNTIQIEQETQIRVLVDGTVQKLNVDYTVDINFESITFAVPPANDALIDIQRIFIQQLDAENYFDVAQTTTSGLGSGAQFTISRRRNVVTIGSTTNGSGYAPGDTLTIAASSFDGGTSPANDIVLTVSSVGTGGALGAFTVSYTPPALVTVFDIGTQFFTATSIDAFTVTVDGVIYRPNIDYTFNSGTQELTFVTIPDAGAVIVVNAQQYFKFVDTITVPGLDSSARFGHTVSCTTDGRQIMIGAPNYELDNKTESGIVYIFDRNVQRFTVVSNAAQQVFTLAGAVTEPVQVLLNNEFLTDRANGTLDQFNSFEWDGTNTVTVYADLKVGDKIEIETNQFTLIQAAGQNIVEEFSNYGSAVDICSNNCSLYAGAPQSSFQIYKGGVVERRVNQSRSFGVIESLNTPTTLTAGHTLRIQNVDVSVPQAPNNNLVGLAAAISNLQLNVKAEVNNSGHLVISIKNRAAETEFNLLQVLPGSVGNLFDVIGFETFTWTQTIVSPYPVDFAGFGSSVSINTSATNLVVGAPKGTVYLETDFDQGNTIFDLGVTIFFTDIPFSGAIYTYDLLSAANSSKNNPSKFVFGEQIGLSELVSYDGFGTAVSYVSSVLAVGAPRRKVGISSNEQGKIYQFINANQLPTWTVIQQQQPTVDIRLLNSIFLYDLVTSATTEFLDFINPLQGKILGAARQNIDYISSIDPAAYNIGPVNIRGTTWGAAHVGEMWWDISSVRFIDPNQDSITYASRRWAQTFPGSVIDVYQWIRSEVPPEAYAGPGTIRDTLSYTVTSRLQPDGLLITEFYFWVRGITNTLPKSRKTLPASVVASYIENPRASGIPYIAPINGSTVALYNVTELIEANDSVIHIEFDRTFTNDNVHVEYELIPQDRADGFVSDTVYRKLQDSFCGVDTFGNQVPDLTLSPAQRYGIQFRPRQSMFVDRFEALRNYLTKVNNVLTQIPVSESRSFNLLNSSEPLPSSSSGQWDLRVANLEELSFQDIDSVPLGYKYLVESDSQNRGLWTVYEVQSVSVTERALKLVQVQLFKTSDYWSYITWYRPGFNPGTKVLTKVRAFGNLSTLAVPLGSVVEVEANAQGKFEWYQLQDIGWVRVALQDGTIEFSAELWDYALGRFGFDLEVFDAQYFDQEPVIETRKIIQAINQELLVEELAIERNRALVLMFNYILSETAAPEWLVKTSLIDVDHRIRDLVPFQNFIQDNQEFVEQYIQEVKPYHVQIREFNLQYNGSDQYLGDLTDFDLPAFFDNNLTVPQFVSPILLPYKIGTAFNALINTVSNTPEDSEIWQQWPYSQWFNNHLLTIKDVEIINTGSGYTEPPEVIISGAAIIPAQAVAITDANNRVVGIEITNPGFGYGATPIIVFEGGNGTGAKAYARMTGRGLAFDYGVPEPSSLPGDIIDYNLSRFVKTTLRFDRYQYQSSVTNWQPNVIYQNGDLVRYDNRVWRAASDDSLAIVTGSTFDFENWQLVPASELSGINRTQGYYVPGANSFGLDLPLLVNGIDYPGPQVFGQSFLGVPALDAVYESDFADTELGERFSDINVEGGAFVGLYEGHAPEELVNGAEFDTVDIRVFTRPGSDWTENGHGFKIGTIRYQYQPLVTNQLSWANVVQTPVQVLVSNLTTGIELTKDINYVVDWDDQFISIIGGVSADDVINITVYEVGGGSQLFKDNYIGADIGQTVIIPVNFAEIAEIAVFINGEITNETVTWEPYAEAVPWSIIDAYVQQQIVIDNNNYYRALADVPPGTPLTNLQFWAPFTPTLRTIVDLKQTYGFDDGITLVALGFTEPNQYSWSTPQVQYRVANQSLVNSKTIQIENSVQGTNPANLIVIRNGRRLRPPEGIEWIGDGSTISFGLSQRSGYQQNIINSISDIEVWINGVLQTQAFGADSGNYSVSNWDGSNVPGRQVIFNTAPAPGARILISVSTVADYAVLGDQLQIVGVVNLNDVFQIITWNDTDQQDILTQVFVGPVVSGIEINEPYDSTDYDIGTVNNEPGSFDFTTGDVVFNNNFVLNRVDVNPSRLWVTLNGFRQFEGINYTVNNNEVVLSGGAIQPTDVFVVTQFTNSIVPDALGFRIFQDMRGTQSTYRITETTTTELVADLSATSDVISVLDASRLAEPKLPVGLFGEITINGERILYRNRNLTNNTLSGLRRGTAGTGAADHRIGAAVYDISLGNRLFDEYQDRIVKDTMFSDSSTATFVALNISNANVYTYADSLVRGQTYIINDIGPAGNQTDFTLIGALDNNVGTEFTVPQSDPPNQPVWPEGVSSGLGNALNINTLEVYVGGTRQYSVSSGITSEYPWTITDTDPVTVEFNDPIPEDLEITILVRQGRSWYEPGDGAASNGSPLQETNTLAARFLQGL